VTQLKPIVSRTTTGTFCVLPVPSHFANRDCGLLVKSDGYADSFAVVAVPELATGIWQEHVLSPGDRTVGGVVVGSEGRPVPHASLQIADVDGRWCLPPKNARRQAGVDGSFSFAGLPKRRLRIFASASREGLAGRSIEIDTGDAGPLRIELHPARTVGVSVPDNVEGSQFCVLDVQGRPFHDDRLSGTVRYGGGNLAVDPAAATIVLFDAVSGAEIGRGPVPADGDLVIEAGERK
jgi:hypothetical protein